jgi:hypothetical protein
MKRKPSLVLLGKQIAEVDHRQRRLGLRAQQLDQLIRERRVIVEDIRLLRR